MGRLSVTATCSRPEPTSRVGVRGPGPGA
jgi:hypothetical protein